jgi:hypothetical protein
MTGYGRFSGYEYQLGMVNRALRPKSTSWRPRPIRGGKFDFLRFSILSTTTVGIHERERSGPLVGRPGLDPGTLRVFPERPGTSIYVQIWWPDEVQCPPTSTEVLSRLSSWLDNWLDPGSFQGHVTFQSREVDCEGLELPLGEE